jgi:hypothetical protein
MTHNSLADRLSTPRVSKITAVALLIKTPQRRSLGSEKAAKLVAAPFPHPYCKDNPVHADGRAYLPGKKALSIAIPPVCAALVAFGFNKDS